MRLAWLQLVKTGAPCAPYPNERPPSRDCPDLEELCAHALPLLLLIRHAQKPEPRALIWGQILQHAFVLDISLHDTQAHGLVADLKELISPCSNSLSVRGLRGCMQRRRNTLGLIQALQHVWVKHVLKVGAAPWLAAAAKCVRPQ